MTKHLKNEIISKRIADLRKLMKSNRIDGYFLPMSDPHGSEMLDSHYHEIAFITGFTGSAGDVLILEKEAFLWTDSRYFLQAKQQLPPEIKLMKQGIPNTESYKDLVTRLSKNGSLNFLGIDTIIMPAQKLIDIKKSAPKLNYKHLNLISKIWAERPAIRCEKIISLPDVIAGETSTSKIARLQAAMNKVGATHYLVSSLDDIAWLFNKRGSDFDNSPLFYSYALISLDEAKLYTLYDGNYYKILDDLKNLDDEVVLITDYTTTPYRFIQVADKVKSIRNVPSLIEVLKSRKNPTELAGMRKAHIQDGLALSRFVHWLKTGFNPNENPMRESDLSDILVQFRKECQEYRTPSFEPILGSGENGAIVHYSFSTGKNSLVENNNLLLADTGGQYDTGTTDVTRTIGIGNTTNEMRRVYTAVLKGHLALGREIFCSDTTGAELDLIPRECMKKLGYEYGHGTGHGVGHMLNVHEGPISISPKGMLPLFEGNVVSNEPGAYLEGKFGVRIENLVEVCRIDDSNLGFRDLTLCPYDNDLIDESLLTDEEKTQINAYHSRIYDELHGYAAENMPEILDDENFWLWLRSQ
ncbi:M24 family metallopeptidase [Eubacteriales bacterium KG125]